MPQTFCLLALFFCCFFTTNTNAEVVRIKSAIDQVNLAPHLLYLEETENINSLEAVQQLIDSKFQLNTNSKLSLGYVGPVWIKVSVLNETNDPHKWLLELDRPKIDVIDFYVVKNDVVMNEWHTGDYRPYENKPIPANAFVFPVTTEPLDIADIYIRISNSTATRTSVILHSEIDYFRSQEHSKLIIGIVLGLAFVLIAYNGVVGNALKDRNHLYYVGYICSAAAFAGSRYGLYTEYLWGHLPWLSDRVGLIALGFINIFWLQFSRTFLQTKELSPRFDQVLKGLLVLALVLLPLTAIFYWQNWSSQILSVMTPLVLLTGFVASIVCLLAGNRSAKYYLIANIAFVLGVALDALSNFAVIPANSFTTSSSIIGYAIQAILLSLALADRIHHLREEKEQAQADSKQALKDANLQLQRINELKDEFLATISHELRTPANGIIGNLEMLGETKLDPYQSQFIANANESSAKLALMIEELLKFSELESGLLKLDNQPFNLASILFRLNKQCHRECRNKSIEYDCLLKEDTPVYLVGDADKLNYLLTLLLDNAIKFTDKGKVSLEVQELKNQPQSRYCFLQFKIVDTGIGMPKTMQEEIFKSFYQLDGSHSRRHGGLGIGLASCKQLAKMFQGQISVSSKEGEGSTFTLTLKLEKDSKKRKTTPEKNKPAPNSTSKALAQYNRNKPLAETNKDQFEVLIVEDNDVNSRMLDALVRKLGYKTHIARNGEEALHTLLIERINLVLMDCQMPVMDGYEATEKIRKMPQFADLPIIAVTANSTQSDRKRCYAVGMNDFIPKPIHIEIIRAAIDRAILVADNKYLIEDQNKIQKESKPEENRPSRSIDSIENTPQKKSS